MGKAWVLQPFRSPEPMKNHSICEEMCQSGLIHIDLPWTSATRRNRTCSSVENMKWPTKGNTNSIFLTVTRARRSINWGNAPILMIITCPLSEEICREASIAQGRCFSPVPQHNVRSDVLWRASYLLQQKWLRKGKLYNADSFSWTGTGCICHWDLGSQGSRGLCRFLWGWGIRILKRKASYTGTVTVNKGHSTAIVPESKGGERKEKKGERKSSVNIHALT